MRFYDIDHSLAEGSHTTFRYIGQDILTILPIHNKIKQLQTTGIGKLVDVPAVFRLKPPTGLPIAWKINDLHGWKFQKILNLLEDAEVLATRRSAKSFKISLRYFTMFAALRRCAAPAPSDYGPEPRTSDGLRAVVDAP